MPKILIIEDDANIVRGLSDNLRFEGHAVITAMDGKSGLQRALREQPELILLDVMLPEMNGFDVLRQVRTEKLTCPIIMLTAKGEEVDKVRGLELGADDYVTKPFGLQELLARVRAALRRSDSGPAKENPTIYKFDQITIRFDRCELLRMRETVPLTARETAILKHFVQHRGKIVTRETLLNEVWGYDRYPSTRTVDNQILALRKKMEESAEKPRYITSIRSMGYRFDHE